MFGAGRNFFMFRALLAPASQVVRRPWGANTFGANPAPRLPTPDVCISERAEEFLAAVRLLGILNCKVFWTRFSD